MIEPLVGVILLLRHTEDATNGLRRELEALNLTEDEKHRCTGAIPTECDSLFEKQYFSEVVRAIYHIEIVSFLSRQPYSELAVGCVYSVGIERGNNLVLYLCIVGSERFARIVGKLNKQKRIDVNANILIGFGEFFTLLHGKPNKMLIERAVRVLEVKSRIKDDVFLNHFFFNDLFARHIYMLLAISLRCCRHSDFNLWLNSSEYFF